MITANTDALWKVVAAVEDPEMPPLTIEDLGILRSLTIEAVPTGDPRQETVVVTITPTYSGCPAVDVIDEEIVATLNAAGQCSVRVERTLAPAWSTDWITEQGKAKLAAAGIAPPKPVSVAIGQPPSPTRCPRCGSGETEQISRFGATACKALHRCRACGEPFDRFKEL